MTEDTPSRPLWDRLDAAMTAALLILLLAIAGVIGHGDQIGIQAQAFSPQDTAFSRTAIQVRFDDPIEPSSVAGHVRLDPPISGTLTVTNR